MLRELLLDSEQIEDFLKKIFSHMKEVEPQDLPSLVYQLVLLASRGHKRVIINGIMSFFSKLQKSELQEAGQNGSKNGKLSYSVLGFKVYHPHHLTSMDHFYRDGCVFEYEASTNRFMISTSRRT